MDQHLKTTVYSPESGVRHPIKLLKDVFADLGQAHSLGLRLAKRNIKAQYRQSMLGYVWSVLPPLVTSMVWVFLNSQSIVNIADPGVPYPLFVLTGTLLWQMFTESVNAPLKGVAGGKSMLAKINFPRESLLLSGMYETLFNTTIKLGLLVGIFIFYQYLPPVSALLCLVGFVALMILGNAVGILLTPIGMLYTDITRLIAVVLQFGIYLTPVIYPHPRSGLAAQLMQYNPIAPVLTTTRAWLLDMPNTGISSFWLITVIALVLYVVGLFFYRLAMPIVIERVGS